MTKSVKAALVDTNVLVSAILSPTSKPAQALSFLQRNFRLLLSTATKDEVTEVLSRDKFNLYLPLEIRLSTLQMFLAVSELLEPDVDIKACVDPKDDKFLSLAVSGRASLLVTGDKHLLSMHPFRGIDILTPKQYLERTLLLPSTPGTR